MVDIFVLTYFRLDYLKTFIEMLYLSTNYPFRLFVINNAKEDTETNEFILRMEKEGLIYKHLFNEQNEPLAKAYTSCFNEFKDELNDFIITAPNDINPPLFKNPDWLTIFVKKMQSDENIGCINFRASRGLFSSFNQRVRPWIEEQIKQRGEEEKYNNLRNLIYGI